MGTPAAVMAATLYCGYHKVHTLIPNHNHSILYFKRFIDDIFCIWTGNLTSDWNAFKDDVNNFGVLKWDIEDITPSRSANFLDMTLTIVNGKIVSRTYQKAMNLHLYIPPSSEHPPSCIKGTIYSLVQRYFSQNTRQEDFAYFVGLLYYRLLQRGWNRASVRELIQEATAKAETKQLSLPSPSDDKSIIKPIFLHFQFHKDGISRKEIRKEFEEHLGLICREELKTDRMVVAYSRPKNIGDFVSQARLHQAPGKNASTILGEYKEGLNPY